MKSLTICYVTARPEPRLDWFLTSLYSQIMPKDIIDLIIVDYTDREGVFRDGHFRSTKYVQPKPNVWQGPHRFTKKEWWAKSAYLNTGLCLANTDYIAFVDDRSVLLPTWLQAVREAMNGNYAVCGSYDKRVGMTVAGGYIKHGGIIIGQDPRKTNSDQPRSVPGSYWFGCTNALPVEWMLQINGAPEECDSLGMEDVLMGSLLQNNGFPIKYDPRMAIAEDRSSEFYEAAVGRTDIGQSPNDKSHGLLKLLAGKKQSTHHWNMREVRERVLRGEPFPIPTEPTHDWFTGKPLSEFP